MPKKIFELANEINRGALEVVEALKKHGLRVRNHMSVLDDEDYEKAIQIFTKQSGSVKKKKVTKVKKAAKKKKVVEAAVPEVKKVPIKRRTVVRKKASVKKDEPLANIVPPVADVLEENLPESNSPQIIEKNEEVVLSPVEQSHESVVSENNIEDSLVQEVPHNNKNGEGDIPSTGDVISEKFAEDLPKGLQVIFRPPEEVPTPKKEDIVPSPVQKIEKAREVGADGKEKIYLKEKMHSFTPVFIPEKTASSEGQRSTRSGEQGAGKPQGAAPRAASGQQQSTTATRTTVTRHSDTPALPAGKDTGVSHTAATAGRSRDILKLRADEELKSYSVGGIYGNSTYTAIQRKRAYLGPKRSTKITEIKDAKRVIAVHQYCTALDLSNKLGEKFQKLADKALDLNLLLAPQDILGIALCIELAALYRYRVEDVSFDEDELFKQERSDSKAKDKILRAPIVAVMGHVDHGKTTLLDHIRKEKVALGEAGGITQHIGAYSVPVNDKKITFLDTPGHEAFGSMRERGAKITDVVILVVAADDGVMPQTRESIRFCQNHNVPIVVAVNKIDKEGARPDRIKQQLSELDLMPEEWGGHTQFVEISALLGTGIDQLMESVLLQTEIMELSADEKGKARGTVIESRLEVGRGAVVTFLVQSGTVKKGDAIVVGECYGQVRNMLDEYLKNAPSAGPSSAIQVLGLNAPPKPGDEFYVVKNLREAKKVAENRANERKLFESTSSGKKKTLEDFFAMKAEDGKKKNLKLLIRADVHGSYEALCQSLKELGNDEVGIEILSGGVGAITDNDVLLAAESSAYIIGFNMRPVTSALRIAEQKGLDIKTYSVIYNAINDISLALEGLLVPEVVEKFIGRAEVRNLFSVPKVGVVAGTAVTDGKIERGCRIRLLRDGKILHDGGLATLKRFKDEVKEVKHGFECGMALENYQNIQVNDIFEAYIFEEKKRTLESSHNNAHESGH